MTAAARPAPDGGPLQARPIPALDGVRGLAILAVLMHQLMLDVPAAASVTSSRLYAALFAPLAAGWVGVQLFFVLSGYLITGILLDTKEAENRWSSFLARRALRIFPAYYLLLAIVFLAVPALVSLPPDVLAEHRYQGWYWLYATNWRFLGSGGHVTPLGPCWSLAVEEQFYLLWPLVVWTTSRAGLARVSFAIVVGAFLLRLGLTRAGVDPETIYECTLTRADALAVGAASALLVRRPDWLARVTPWLGAAAWAVGLALAATAFASGGLSRRNPVTETVGQSEIALASAVIVLCAALGPDVGRGRAAAWLSLPVLRWFGRYSYAIYLFHFPLHLLAVKMLLAPRLIGADRSRFLVIQTAYLVVAPLALLAFGWIFHQLFESRFLRLKRYFPARKPIFPT